jgi:hypothetical protein
MKQVIFLLLLLLTVSACTAPDPVRQHPFGTPTPPVAQPPALREPETPPAAFTSQFRTDFSRSLIPFSDILSGGPPKDGIPAIDNPTFVSVAEADGWIGPREPVLVYEGEGVVRIYPYQILTWHEIVNDVVGDRPITVTFCPLCNTAIIFDATVHDEQLTFGTTGRLRHSNLLMYDRQSESWWQQAGGDALIGHYAGVQLTLLPAVIVSWAEASGRYPSAEILSRNTGFDRSYGRNPYAGYDDLNATPFLFSGDTPDQLPAMARVTTVVLNGEAVAWPNAALQQEGVVNDSVGGVPVAVFWQPGLASALDTAQIATGQEVGANGVFERTLNGRLLTFAPQPDGTIRDAETATTWNLFGEGTDGPLAGERLTPVVKVDHFWFSWAAFRPDTRVWGQ